MSVGSHWFIFMFISLLNCSLLFQRQFLRQAFELDLYPWVIKLVTLPPPPPPPASLSLSILPRQKPVCLSFCLSVGLCLSRSASVSLSCLCLCLCLSVSLSLPVSVSVSFSLPLSLPVWLSLYLCLSVCLSALSVAVCLCLSPSLSLLSLSLSLSVCLPPPPPQWQVTKNLRSPLQKTCSYWSDFPVFLIKPAKFHNDLSGSQGLKYQQPKLSICQDSNLSDKSKKMLHLFPPLSEIHGNFTTWSAWSPCQSLPGNGDIHGYQERSRSCDDPAPRYNGDVCVGDTIEMQPCLLTATA